MLRNGAVERPGITQMNPNIAVVVAVNNDKQFSEYVLASPGLKEIKVQIIPVRGSKSGAEAFYQGVQQTECPWILYCHQDVFFPEGSGQAIEKILPSLSKDTILGFAGMVGKLNSDDVKGTGIVQSGRSGLIDFPSRRTDAISLDEFAIVLNRECKYKIDPKLGWHLWGTDLCLQSAIDGCSARVERVLLTHYSSHDYIGDGGLPAEFFDSQNILIAKYHQLHTIHSLCVMWHREAPAPKRSLRRPPRLGR